MTNEQSICTGRDCEVSGCDCDTTDGCHICSSDVDLTTMTDAHPAGGRITMDLCRECLLPQVGTIHCEAETSAEGRAA